MSLRRISRIIGAANGDAVCVVYLIESEEYRVELWRDGARYTPADYFTTDLDDANGTADDMLARSAARP